MAGCHEAIARGSAPWISESHSVVWIPTYEELAKTWFLWKNVLLYFMLENKRTDSD